MLESTTFVPAILSYQERPFLSARTEANPTKPIKYMLIANNIDHSNCLTTMRNTLGLAPFISITFNPNSAFPNVLENKRVDMVVYVNGTKIKLISRYTKATIAPPKLASLFPKSIMAKIDKQILKNIYKTMSIMDAKNLLDTLKLYLSKSFDSIS